MSTLFKWLFRVFVSILGLGILAIIGVYYLASRSLPEYSAEFDIAGLTGDVEIVRDNANVPHIFGPTDEDVYFGLGFAHAQDRLWQMVIMRRTAEGRLSEVFGERALPLDDIMRRLDLYDLAKRSVRHQDAKTIEILEAYAAGVNAWLEEVNTGARGRGAPELFLFPNTLAPWTPADSLAIGKLMAMQLSAHMENEVLRARATLALPPERLADIMPDNEEAPITELADYAALFPKSVFPRYAEYGDIPADMARLSPFKARGMAGASNAWAAAPARSANGGTLLANDPHLEFAAPSIWYLARIELEHGGIIGGTIPGTPVVLSGRSDHLGWAMTSSYADDQDVFIEKLNPDDPEEYLTPDGYKRFEIRQTIVKVKDSEPRTLTMRWTENGPVLPARHYDVGKITPAGHVASMSWTALSPRDTSVAALLALNRATTIDEAIAAGENYISSSVNITMVTADEIALKTFGVLPKRSYRHQTKGRIPSPGWIEHNRWNGRLSYGLNPEYRAPASGLLANTNDKVIDRRFPNHMSFLWGDTERVKRLERLLQSRDVHTRESFMEAQLDTVSPTARRLLPLIAKDLWFKGATAPEGTPERQRQIALDLLADWNGEMNEHLPEPLIYAAWMRSLQTRLIRDELGPLEESFTHINPVFLARVFLDVDGASAWCDVVQSTQTEDCTEIARIALDEALVMLRERYNKDLASLRWGDAHIATHNHAVLGTIPVLNWFVNIHQSTSGGDNTLMRGTTLGTGPDPFQNVHGAGYRGVYDFADPDSSVFIMSTGQSGHPLSRFYDDLGELWRRGEYIPMSLDPELARAGSVGITVLRAQAAE
ncbi:MULTISPECIES: penicillin acylase family protein [Halocynthiibacter]|uniref:Penicillin acylase family protein n=1 Tax=Halocynthiibacter halioticoli TaxID=2986804 RepID=A0AAE3J308_9RHOB|nr:MULTISPECIES: penicillin acylase family protein [Halocynthiibacter]MCV6824387.1 penicillin acylase family protein [Halocynthiibacter halioticoli]MCW4057388.1 penicillin acylase family protein [Halocynthiibacter sp. SDUM655004]